MQNTKMLKNIVMGWILITAFSLLISACGSEPEPTPTPTRPAVITPTKSPAVEAEVPQLEPKAVIEKAIAAEDAILTKRTHATISKNGNLLKMDFDYIAPDRYYINLQGIEMIVIGNQAYAKYDGKWRADPEGAKTLEENLDDVEQGAVEILEASYLDEVTYRDEKTHIYKVRTRWTDNEGTKISDGKVWIRLADGLPVKAEKDLFLGNLRYRVNMQVEYNLDLKIEPPV